MTTWLVTTGMSLLDSSRCWEVEGLSDNERRGADNTGEIPPWSRYASDWPDRARTIRQWVKDNLPANPDLAQVRARSFDVNCWSDGAALMLSAELTTLFHLRNRVQAEDLIVFVHGPDDNQKCALWAEAVCERLVDEGRLTVAGLSLSGPYHWDPAGRVAFHAVMADLWAREVAARDFDVRLVVTGGYKAVLMWLAAKLVTAPQAHGVSCYYFNDVVGSSVIEVVGTQHEGLAARPVGGPGIDL